MATPRVPCLPYMPNIRLNSVISVCASIGEGCDWGLGSREGADSEDGWVPGERGEDGVEAGVES